VFQLMVWNNIPVKAPPRRRPHHTTNPHLEYLCAVCLLGKRCRAAEEARHKGVTATTL
jgi:hypothetical protein